MCGNPSFDFAVTGQHYWPFMAGHALTSQAVRRDVAARVLCAVCLCIDARCVPQEFAALDKACNGVFVPPAGKPLSAECTGNMTALRPLLIGINPYNIYAEVRSHRHTHAQPHSSSPTRPNLLFAPVHWAP